MQVNAKWEWPLLRHAFVPVGDDPAAFGVKRKNHFHEGVDLHVIGKESVFAVEDGIIRHIDWFTGPDAGSPWWLPTKAMMVEGAAGLVVYGEIEPFAELQVGDRIKQGSCLGWVMRVLVNDKGAPTEMLHIELRKPGHTERFDWTLDKEKPDWLLDPTPYLLEAR